jgi:membrane-associated phospholipid phosphatase
MPSTATLFLIWLRPNRLLLTTAIISLLLFTLIAALVFIINVPIDDFILAKSLRWENKQATTTLKGITFLGNYQFLIPANLLLIFFLINKGEKKGAGLVLFTALTSLGLKLFLKELFHRPRPVAAIITGIKNYSFPSGHALMSITFYGLLGITLYYFIPSKKIKTFVLLILVLLILLIGFSRIYLRVHYTTDVMAGYCLGYCWLIFCIWLFSNSRVYTQNGAL